MSVHYYIKNNKVTSSNDIGSDRPMNLGRTCDNVYLSQAPIGYYMDLGAEKIGNRPVWNSYEVGKLSIITPRNYVPAGRYNCRQPCWGRDCR